MECIRITLTGSLSARLPVEQPGLVIVGLAEFPAGFLDQPVRFLKTAGLGFLDGLHGVGFAVSSVKDDLKGGFDDFVHLPYHSRGQSRTAAFFAA